MILAQTGHPGKIIQTDGEGHVLADIGPDLLHHVVVGMEPEAQNLAENGLKQGLTHHGGGSRVASLFSKEPLHHQGDPVQAIRLNGRNPAGTLGPVETDKQTFEGLTGIDPFLVSHSPVAEDDVAGIHLRFDPPQQDSLHSRPWDNDLVKGMSVWGEIPGECGGVDPDGPESRSVDGHGTITRLRFLVKSGGVNGWQQY